MNSKHFGISPAMAQTLVSIQSRKSRRPSARIQTSEYHKSTVNALLRRDLVAVSPRRGVILTGFGRAMAPAARYLC